MSSAVAEKPVRKAEPVQEEVESRFPYPGIPTTCDGSEAVVHVDIHICQAAGAYPITSSTTIGGGFNPAVMNGMKNPWGAGEFWLSAGGAAEDSHTPFFSAQDGFLTTHTVETVRLPEPEFMKEFIGSPKDKLINLMDPANPVMSGVVQNQDSYMKGKIAQHWYYDRVGPALEDAFAEFHRQTGRQDGMVEQYRCADAEYILVGMGCSMDTPNPTVHSLPAKRLPPPSPPLLVFPPF